VIHKIGRHKFGSHKNERHKFGSHKMARYKIKRVVRAVRREPVFHPDEFHPVQIGIQRARAIVERRRQENIRQEAEARRREQRRQRRRERRQVRRAMAALARQLQVHPVYPSDTDDLELREDSSDSDATP
jgi:hypothetical protein